MFPTRYSPLSPRLARRFLSTCKPCRRRLGIPVGCVGEKFTWAAQVAHGFFVYFDAQAWGNGPGGTDGTIPILTNGAEQLENNTAKGYVPSAPPSLPSDFGAGVFPFRDGSLLNVKLTQGAIASILRRGTHTVHCPLRSLVALAVSKTPPAPFPLARQWRRCWPTQPITRSSSLPRESFRERSLARCYKKTTRRTRSKGPAGQTGRSPSSQWGKAT